MHARSTPTRMCSRLLIRCSIIHDEDGDTQPSQDECNWYIHADMRYHYTLHLTGHIRGTAMEYTLGMTADKRNGPEFFKSNPALLTVSVWCMQHCLSLSTCRMIILIKRRKKRVVGANTTTFGGVPTFPEQHIPVQHTASVSLGLYYYIRTKKHSNSGFSFSFFFLLLFLFLFSFSFFICSHVCNMPSQRNPPTIHAGCWEDYSGWAVPSCGKGCMARARQPDCCRQGL